MVGMSELIININRYNLLYDNVSKLDKVPLKYVMLLLLVTCFSVFTPEIMSREILYVIELNKYTYRVTDFGNSYFYNIYVIVSIGLFYLIILSCVAYLNTINLIKYRELKNFAQSRSKRFIKKFKKNERNFTVMILITTVVFISLSIINIVCIAFTRIYYLNGIYYDPVINLFRGFIYFVWTLHYLNDPILYILIDINLKNALLA